MRASGSVSLLRSSIRLVSALLYPSRLLLGSVITMLGMDVHLPVHKILLLRRILRIAIGIGAAWVYRAGMESSRFQATLGKMAVGLRVTDLEGCRIDFARATIRYFAKYVSTLALGIGYLMVAFDEQKQGLHDEIAKTLVIYR